MAPVLIYTDRQEKEWILVNPSRSVHPGFIDAVRMEDGVSVTVCVNHRLRNA